MPVTTDAATTADPAYAQSYPLLTQIASQAERYHLVHELPPIRLFFCAQGIDPPAALLQLDRLFDIRCAAALQLWRLLCGKAPGRGPKPLTTYARQRLILALRALDARRQHASYRDIAKGLFHLGAMTARNWETHDLRDRTIRLVELGTGMMEGGYRQLLVYPFRTKL